MGIKAGFRHMDWRQRFWYKVTPNDETNCWEWTGTCNPKGYGVLTVDGKSRTTHRLVWEMLKGPIPKDGSHHGICVCHRCDNPKCVNINHLFLGTMADNVADRDRKGRHVCNKQKRIRETGKCMKGLHDWTPENIRRTKQGRNLCLACNRAVKHKHHLLEYERARQAKAGAVVATHSYTPDVVLG